MPTLNLSQQYYFNVYQAVQRDRPAGFAGPLPIGLGPVRKYCEFFNITSVDMRDRIFRFVSAMDDAYLEHIRKKNPPSKK